MRFCPYCGKEVQQEAEFCPTCGGTLEIEPSQAAVAPQPVAPQPTAPAPTTQVRRSHTRRNIVIVAVVVIAIVAIVSFTLLNSFGGIIFAQHTVSIETGSVTVAAQTYQSIQFTVPDGASNIMVQGIFTASGGSGNDIKVYIMSSTNFTNWQNGHQVNAIYNSGQVTTESINIQLPSSGSYYVVFDNSFSPFSSKTVFAQLNLVYTK